MYMYYLHTRTLVIASSNRNDNYVEYSFPSLLDREKGRIVWLPPPPHLLRRKYT